MTPELKRAIIKFVPDYFYWDITRQEQYRVNIPEEDAVKIQQFLLKELFNITVFGDDEKEEVWDEMTVEQCTKINATLLPLKGIGEDFFYLNECFDDSKNLLSFKTLYDFDFDDYKFQEGSRKKDLGNYSGKPYRGSLYLTWTRLMIDGRFSYGVLSMVAGYLYNELDEYGNGYIEKLIPYEFKQGKHHGKAVSSGYLYDMQVDAEGLEPQLEELRHRFWNHLNIVYEKLMDEFDRKSNQHVFILDQSKPGDPCHHFLFSDKEILKHIHFKTFMSDCRASEQKDLSFLFQKLEEEKKLLTEYLDEQYKDLIENFNPKIFKLRKKRKVIFHKDSGFDKLL